jgi:hypothetical protein
MTKTISYTLLTLVLLTVVTALVSNYIDLAMGVFFILILSAIKFVFVAFQFMELKKANSFWKIILSVYLMLFITIVLILI